MLGGVCAGVARSAGLDPLLLRIAVVAVTLMTGGAGLLAYLVAWVLIPREDASTALPAVGAGGRTGEAADVRAAWTAAGNDLRSLATELRRPGASGHTAASGPGMSTTDATTTDATTTGTTTAGTTTTDATTGTPDDPTGPEGSSRPEPAADDPPAAPAASDSPSPRSPLAAADDAATALGDRLRAPDVQTGARKAATSVSEALNASVEELGRRLHRDPS